MIPLDVHLPGFVTFVCISTFAAGVAQVEMFRLYVVPHVALHRGVVITLGTAQPLAGPEVKNL